MEGWFGFQLGSTFAFAVVMDVEGRQSLRFNLFAGFLEHLSIQPADFSRSADAAAQPERLIRIRCEIQVVRLKARADQGELARGRIEHGKMAIRFLDGKRLRGRMVRALFAEIRILA